MSCFVLCNTSRILKEFIFFHSFLQKNCDKPPALYIFGNNRSCSNRAGFHSGHAGTTETCVRTRKWIASEKLSSPRTSTLGFPSAVDGIPYQPKQLVLAVKRVRSTLFYDFTNDKLSGVSILLVLYHVLYASSTQIRKSYCSNPLSQHILLGRGLRIKYAIQSASLPLLIITPPHVSYRALVYCRASTLLAIVTRPPS